MSIDYGVVIEGILEITLDSGEKRILHPGDVCINRGANHKWRNVLAGKSSRALWVLLDVKPLYVGGKLIEEDLGDLAPEYADVALQHKK